MLGADLFFSPHYNDKFSMFYYYIKNILRNKMFQQFVLQPSEAGKTNQSVEEVLTYEQYQKQIPLEERQNNTKFETFFDQLLKFKFDILIKWNGNSVLTQLLKDLEKERPKLENEAIGMGKRADTNKDGKIKIGELRTIIRETTKVREKMFIGKAKSRNKDGLQLYSYQQAMKQMTAQNQATLSQFQEWFINNRLKTIAKQFIDRLDSKDKSQLFAALPTELLNNLFTKFDTDTNDRISINELSDLLNYFELTGNTFLLKNKFDTNKNGLELSEILQMIQYLAPRLIETQLALEPVEEPVEEPAQVGSDEETDASSVGELTEQEESVGELTEQEESGGEQEESEEEEQKEGEEEQKEEETPIPDNALAELREAFDKYDVDGSGRISLEELRRGYEQAGEDPEEAFAALQTNDSNADGEIDFDEFVRWSFDTNALDVWKRAQESEEYNVTLGLNYEFPEGLKKLNNSADNDKSMKYVVPPSEEKTAQARIDMLIRTTFGGETNKTSDELSMLFSDAYIPYLLHCCQNKQPLIHLLPSGIKLSHGCITTRPVRSGLRTEQRRTLNKTREETDKRKDYEILRAEEDNRWIQEDNATDILNNAEEEINMLLNKDFNSFMTQFGNRTPYTRDDLFQGKLLGSFYTEKQRKPKINPDKNKTTLANPRTMADVIQNMVNLGDADAHNTIERLYGQTLDDGPIQSRFYRLNLNVNEDGYKKSINGRYGTFNQLLGICGHSPIGALPFIYCNNMCCDTTYAAGAPLARPALSIEAVLRSNSDWEFEIKLPKGQKATVVDSKGNRGEEVMIFKYVIRSSYIPKDPLPEQLGLYRHFVGRYTSGTETKEIWRQVRIEAAEIKAAKAAFAAAKDAKDAQAVKDALDHASNEFSPKFWIHEYEYTVHTVDLEEQQLLENFHQYDVIDDNGLMYMHDVFTADDLKRFAKYLELERDGLESLSDAKIDYKRYRDFHSSEVLRIKLDVESIEFIRREKAPVTENRYNIISDIEGNLPFLTGCIELIKKTNTLVVLGDMWDRGTAKAEREIWTELLKLKKTIPNLITIVGNRDINKLRWLMELNNFIPRYK